MQPHVFLPSSLLALFLFTAIVFLSIEVPSALCGDDPQYLNCNRTFDCGNVQGVGYPFWGDGRPSYCGPPEFRLVCGNNNLTSIEIMSQSYRVLQIDTRNRILKVARVDVLDDGICKTQPVNTSLNFTPFTSIPSDLYMNLFYGCSLGSGGQGYPYDKIPAKVSCPYNGDPTEVLYIIDQVPIHEDYSSSSGVFRWSCKAGVSLPVPPIPTEMLVNNIESNLSQVIRQGFQLGWNLSDASCTECWQSSGQCGYNSTLNRATCFCRHGSSAKSCSDKKRWVKVALGISSGVIAGAFLVICIVLCRKKLKFGLVKRKDISTPSTTVSSNPSSRTKDLEKGSIFMGVSIPIFTYEVLEEATNNFDASKELGDGGFGTVYHGKLRDGRDVAVKRLYENNYRRVEQFMNEIEILTRLRHKNLVTLYGCTSRRSRELILVYEYIPNGTVADHLHGDRAKAGGLPWSIRMSIALETAGALTYLHASDIIHRDVKTNNILLDNNFSVKVADFGLSRLFPTDATHVSTAPQGTPGYVDPEYHQCYQLTGKSDVYSFGVVLIELISSKPAVDISRHRHEINLATMAMNKIQNRALHELVDPDLNFESDSAVRRMVTGMAELAFRCLQYDREMRPTMDEALEILNAIGNEDYNVTKTEEVDTQSDQVGLLKNNKRPPTSPVTVTYPWSSEKTTPNTSS
ncbi:PREDICTED: LEAF RUST 10 DISEASE-RESISTANCE LOCUS RECEPTOR-LIKE PROTEIN KINASE-like 1.2 isoform X2 [Nelumbo nucifera]|uniref:non-specific serine/threonine protein kinase n=1 Tax=Nelumbo nucifera TaxID=4432 RepID=A0A1U8BCX8_NELNU|nr:PREDICTED: LEAF RUST 10 DISEASE-RESISTANCE LOCUS RECEPTOR-LIKE PROTEIN KINASE-like 1.2 isoform X2 [Nelumbo nucifera]